METSNQVIARRIWNNMKNWLSGFVLAFELWGTIIPALGKTTEEKGYIILCHNKKKLKICKWNTNQKFLG